MGIRFSPFSLLILAVLCMTLVAGVAAAGDKAERSSEHKFLPGSLGLLPVAPDSSQTGRLPGAVYSPLGQNMIKEVEPNGTAATAQPLPGSQGVILGNSYPAADIDFYSFTAAAGDRVYAATMTSFSASSVNSILDIIGSDGTTILETDLDDGVFSGTASGIAGTIISAPGTYYIRVRENTATGLIRPYHLQFRLQSGTPDLEIEPNDSTVMAQPLPSSGWISGSSSTTADVDFYSLALNAGDTIYASLDLDPTRDNTQWNGQLGVAVFGGFILVVNDASTGSATNPLSESHFMTVKDAGTYYVFVGVPTGGTTIGDYHLSVTVQPASTGICTTYASTDVPQTIPTGPGSVVSTLTIPGNPRIGELRVNLDLTHALMADLDVTLTSPAGNLNALFTDIGNSTAGGPSIMNMGLDDRAGIPYPAYTITEGMVIQPEFSYRLAWFNGEDAGGTWTLTLNDDLATNGGTLNNWSLTVCDPPPPPSCPGGMDLTTVFSTDFESGDAGFTHSGTADEWQLGLPTSVPVTGCNSGANCWKTDLTGTYNASSNQDLLSPTIDLSLYSNGVWLKWAQKYQIETASFDHAFVDVRQAGGANPTRLFEWLDATMTTGVGAVTIQESAGWAEFTSDISAYQGQNIDVLFHLDSDASVQLAGLAIDDVSVVACVPSGCPTITLSPATLPDGDLATVYDQTVTASGGTAPYTYSFTGTLPPGLSLNSSTGQITGTPTLVGTYNFTIIATDTNLCNGSQAYTVNITGGGLDVHLSANGQTVDDSGTGGNNDGEVDVNECFNLFLGVHNTGTDPATGVSAVLSTTTPEVTIVSNSSAYPDIGPGATEINSTAFEVQISGTFVCGTDIALTLDVTTTQGLFSLSYTLPSGGPGAPVDFTVSGPLPIPDGLGGGGNGPPLDVQFVVSGMTGPITSVTLGLHITHTFDGDLDMSLISPLGTTIDLSSDNGSTGDNYGTDCPVDSNDTTFDDAAATAITAGTAPFTGSFRPEQALAAFDGEDPNGTWTLRIVDDFAADTGDLQCARLSIATTVCDNAGCVGCPTITLSPATLPDGTLGAAYSQTVSASGGTAPYTFAVTTGTLPAGLTLDANTGVISGTPLGPTGASNFTITATDDNGCTGGQDYTINILCPLIDVSPATLPDGTAGAAYNQTVSGTGGTAPYTFAVTLGTLPTGLTLDGNTGAISGTPTASGPFNFTITATDANGCTGSRAYSITINCPAIDVSPTTLPDGTVGAAYNQTVSGTGGTAPYTFAVTLGALPAGVTLNGGTGVISGTPTASGLFSFTMTATDANGCTGSRAYSINVNCPVIDVSPATLPDGTAGVPYNQTVSGTGGTAPYTFAVSGSLPTGLTLDGNTGDITGTPTVSGTFDFTITATDAFGCTGSRDYTINTNCPTITLTPATLPGGTVGAVYAATVSASGGIAPYTFALAAGSLPPGVTLDGSTGNITGIPTASGTFDVTISATDAAGCSGNIDYSISIVPACMFCDDFEDGVLAGNWNYIKPAWTEGGGLLTGTPAAKKAVAVATPAFGGCDLCYEESSITTTGGVNGKVWMLGWYIDKKNMMELLIKEANDKVLLKQRANGSILAKNKAIVTIDPNTTYVFRVAFDGTQFTVTMNGNVLFTLTPVGVVPVGTIGYQVKNTVATYGYITVNP